MSNGCSQLNVESDHLAMYLRAEINFYIIWKTNLSRFNANCALEKLSLYSLTEVVMEPVTQ